MIGTGGRCGWGGISEEDGGAATGDGLPASREVSSLKCCAEVTTVVLDHRKNIAVRYLVRMMHFGNLNDKGVLHGRRHFKHYRGGGGDCSNLTK